jgi:uncharacterized damage-inducible protein DinB
MPNKKITAFAHAFTTIYDGNPWYGESMSAILNKVTPSSAFRQAGKGAHTIAQLVAHIVYWRQSLIKRLEGDLLYRSSMKSDDNWPANTRLKRLGWKNLRRSLHESQQKLVRLLHNQSDTLLKKKYSEKATYHDLINGILQHDLYHLGQVAYLASLFTKK